MDARVALHASDETTRLALVRAFESAPCTWNIFLWDGREPFDVLVSDSAQDHEAITFDPADPQRAVAQVEESLSGSRLRVSVVTGARRGCGVTTVALHLSSALAASRDVCLLDLDPTSSLRARLGLPVDARHWGEVDDGVLSAALPLSGGFRLLLAPRDGRGNASQVLHNAAVRFDHVVVDAPASPWRALSLGVASSAILVIPPSRQGVVHAREILARHRDVRWSCLVNRMGAGGEMTARHVARAIGRPVSLELPCSPYLRDREDEHLLLTARWSRLFRRISRLAGAVG